MTAWLSMNIGHFVDDEITTLGDLREFIREADRIGLKDDHQLEECCVTVGIDNHMVELIECGDHIPRHGVPIPVDALVNLHDCR